MAVALHDVTAWKKIGAELPTYLDVDGLAKYFPTMGQGSDVMTAYLLTIAAEAGFKIPPASLELLLAGLRKFIEGKITRGTALPTTDLHVRKLAAVVALAHYGITDPKFLSSLTIEPDLWPTSAVLDWFDLLRLDKSVEGRELKAAVAEQILRSRLIFHGTTMGFSSETSDSLWWLMVSPDSNSVRLVQSLLNWDRWPDALPKLVRGALARQQRGAWSQTTANAWGVLALEKFSRVFEQVAVSGVTKASLAGLDQKVDWKVGSPAPLEFRWPAGIETLAINHEGTGKPWVTVQSRAAIPLKEAFSSGFKITKTMSGIQRKDSGHWSRGDLVRVHLDLESQADMTWVVVNDPIPGGATVLGGGLGRDSQLATHGEHQGGWVYPAFSEHSFEAYRSYFDFVPKGKWSVEYTIRLNQEGTYHLPATRVEAMYSPEAAGEIPNADVEVTK